MMSSTESAGDFDQAGADDVADGPDADDQFLHLLFFLGRQQIRDGQPLVVAADAFARVAEINRRHPAFRA